MLRVCLMPAVLWMAASCAAPSSFVLTGDLRPERGNDSPVQPYLTGAPGTGYREIGVVEVRGRTLEDRVERAARVAREKGGNGIILLNSQVHVQSTGTYSSVVIQPVFAPAGALAFANAPATQVSSYEVDRYVVIYVDPEAKRADVQPPDAAAVRVFWTAAPDERERIGVIEVAGASVEERLEAAKALARSQGGNALLFLEGESEVETRGAGAMSRPHDSEYATDVRRDTLLSRGGRTLTRTKKVDRFAVLHLPGE
ncbi:MAG: hypothetical protein AAFP04_05185 [Myxococcota bacterium]